MYSHDWTWCPWCGHHLVERNIYDANRMACPNCDFIYFPRPNVVVIVLVVHDGKLLLGRRKMEPGRGKWSFVSGYVNIYERVEAAAVREVKEETGLDVELDGLIGLYDEIASGLVMAAYVAHVTSACVALSKQAHEIGDLAFFSPADLPELAFAGDRKIISDWQNNRLLPLLEHS